MVSDGPLENLASFQMLEVTFLNHCDDRVIDSSLVVKPHGHLVLEFLERNLCSDGDSPLDRFLDLLGHISELNRCFAFLA